MVERRWVLLVAAGLAAAGLLQVAPTVTLPGGESANAAVAFGFAVGLVAGTLGTGGVWLMVPLMLRSFSVDIRTAIGTALAAQVVITLAASRERLRHEREGRSVAVALVAGGILGTPIGLWLSGRAPDPVLRWLYVLLLAGMAARLAWTMLRRRGDGEHARGRDLSAEVLGEERVRRVEEEIEEDLEKAGVREQDLERFLPRHVGGTYRGDRYEVDTPSLVVAGVVFGIVNTLLGTSSPLVVAFLDAFLELGPHLATAVSLFTATAISVPAALGHAAVGDLELGLAAALAAGGVPGAMLGALVNERAPGRWVELALLSLLVALAVVMALP